ncbi:MAG TPA: hypothetical protein VKB46_23250 [Pyrinomonadaceae bacterium]|nr:hypothetical protein [Pyrinomonadaceae bacterium]
MNLVRVAPLLLALNFSSQVTAQATQTKSVNSGKTASTKAVADPNADRELKVRRDQARSLLIALASDARSFRDQTLRARSLARIADSLWTVDSEEARSLFRKAWEAAELADQENDRKTQEEINSQKLKTGGSFALNLPASVRREVLRLASRKDRSLGEEFLEKLKNQKQEATQTRTSDVSDALRQRLELAGEFLNSGDFEKALQFAEPALSTINLTTVDFLCKLREKNAALADGRYAAMLAASSRNPQADANTVSLLFSYIFTPHLFITFSRGGTSSSQSSSTVVAAPVSPELRTLFFQTAEGILMRPLPVDPDPAAASGPGAEGKFLAIKRMLPIFEQYATPETVETVRAQLEVLSSAVSENTRTRDDNWIRKGVQPEKPVEDQEKLLLDRIERAKTSAERDSIYLQLAFSASGRGDLRAREFVSKVEDSEMRNRAGAFIDASLAIGAISGKDTEKALEIARIGDLTHVQKSWVYSQSAKLLAKTDKDKALALIENAADEARRIEGSDPNRPRALLGVASVLLLLDLSRVWEATFEAVKAANSVEGFTGEDAELNLQIQTKGSSSAHSNSVEDFDVEGVFRALASQDFDRSVELARGFQAEGPRAIATIAIARAILEQKTANASVKN